MDQPVKSAWNWFSKKKNKVALDTENRNICDVSLGTKNIKEEKNTTWQYTARDIVNIWHEKLHVCFNKLTMYSMGTKNIELGHSKITESVIMAWEIACVSELEKLILENSKYVFFFVFSHISLP